MGAGGRNDDKSKRQEDSHFHRTPTKKPPFTFSQIKNAIPPHCFQRSLLRSFSDLVYDLCLSSLFYYIANTYIHLLPYPLPYIAWPIYWFVQGSVLTGVWVIAHECGHHGFSDYQWVDDTIGLIFHSALLTPYFSWKYSHRRHHANTGSMENDEVYVPRFKSSIRWYARYTNNPPGRFLSLAISLVLAWPLYLVFNASGRNYGRYASHFDPYSPIYSDRERLQVFVSDAALFAVTYLLYMAAASKGLVWVMCIYGGPLLVVNGFVVIITFLHHTHIALPHYDSSEWDFLKGALATVDRDFGVLNKVLHNITDTHVTHHLFSSLPHYHAMEATNAIKPILGEYYRIDRTPVFKALWREAKECLYVEPDEDGDRKGVFWYRNKL